MTDMFGQYKSQSTRALEQIDSSKYPDTNKDIEANLQRLNTFVDYLAEYVGVMQKGVDQANMDVFQRTRDILSNFVILLGGGSITDIDFGDLQYFLPAIGALFGFDSDVPFPINLFHAAERFLLGYIVPLDSFAFVIQDIIIGWAEAFGLNEEFIAALNSVIEELIALGTTFGDIFDNLWDLLDIFGVGTGIFGPFADIWHSITQLLGGFSLETLGDLTDPIFHALAPWVRIVAQFVDWLNEIVMAFSGGLADLEGILNFSQMFTPFLDFVGGVFEPVAAVIEWVTNAIIPQNILAALEGGLIKLINIPGLDASKIISGVFDALQIPGLLAEKIVGGVLDILRIPNLDASKITTGNFNQNMIAGLVNLVNLIRGGQISGSNLVNDSRITNTTMWTGTNFDAVMSTEQKRSDTHSIKMQGPSKSVHLVRNELGQDVRISTTEGEQFYIEAWVYPPASNTGAGNIVLSAATWNAAGVQTDVVANNITASTLTEGVFQKVSGYATIPANAVQVVGKVSTNSSVPSGDIYYWDDPIFREVTESRNVFSFLSGIINSFRDTLVGWANSTDTDLDNWLLRLVFGDSVPLSSINTNTPNLWLDPNFQSTARLVGFPDWSFDSVNKIGSAGNGLKTTGGATRTWIGPKIANTGQPLTLL
jgi:hypothetical protein